ncbi:MAG: transposase [Spirochaetia bacterium]|nr:transposase [Spirochaetia bacterium]MDY4211984.1 transposase [Treponema sp.]
MTQEQIIRNCENLIDGESQDPLYDMLYFMMNYLMQSEVERKTGVTKGKHSEEVMIVKAINMDGKPDIIAVQPMENKSEATYSELFENLKSRGLETVWLCVSDAHQELQTAIKKCFLGSVWQRCKVHFMRNIMATVPKKQKKSFGTELKKIWQASTREDAIKLKEAFVEKYAEKYPAAECVNIVVSMIFQKSLDNYIDTEGRKILKFVF